MLGSHVVEQLERGLRTNPAEAADPGVEREPIQAEPFGDGS